VPTCTCLALGTAASSCASASLSGTNLQGRSVDVGPSLTVAMQVRTACIRIPVDACDVEYLLVLLGRCRC
jgi:hypothetical protein